jgi:hypothetical protein
MNILDLSKDQKKIARQIIETGLVREFEIGIGKIDGIIQQWKDGKRETKESYYKIYEKLMKFDKHIGQRYNNMSGSDYLLVIAAQLADGIISIDDLSACDQGVKDKIIYISRINEK